MVIPVKKVIGRAARRRPRQILPIVLAVAYMGLRAPRLTNVTSPRYDAFSSPSSRGRPWLARMTGRRTVCTRGLFCVARPRPALGFIGWQAESAPCAPGSRESTIPWATVFTSAISLSTPAKRPIESAFAAAGEVREVAMPTDRETGQPAGSRSSPWASPRPRPRPSRSSTAPWSTAARSRSTRPRSEPAAAAAAAGADATVSVLGAAR